MLRFCPTGVAACLIAACAGCRQVDLHGRWHGKLPLSGGSECRIRLMNRGEADFTCGGSPGYVGTGRWTLQGRTLNLTATWMAVGNQPEKGRLPSWQFALEPAGNECRLTEVGTGQSFQWQRR